MTMPPGDGRNVRSWPSADAIDPESVPDWPHPVVAAQDDAITIDGYRFDLPPGVDPQSSTARQIALQAVVGRFAELGRPIKVRARDADGTGWDLILAPDGSVAPIGTDPVELPGGKVPRKRGRRRQTRPAGKRKDGPAPDKKRGLVAVAVFAVVVLAFGATMFALTRSDTSTPRRTKSAAPTTPPAANLPVPPPPGYASRATWSVQMDEETGVAVTPDHEVALINEEGDLEVRDVATGVLRWESDLPLNTQGYLHTTRIGGKPVLALGESSSLTYWRLDDPQHAAKRVALPDSATLSFVGESPLVLLPDQTAGYVTGTKATLVDVPVGASAISSTGSEVLAVDARGRMWRLRGGQDRPPAPTTLEAPARGARVIRAAHLSNDMLLVAWKYDSTRIVVLYESPGGAERGRKAFTGSRLDESETLGPAGADDEDVLASDDASVVTMGDMAVFTKIPQAYLIEGMQVNTVSGGHLYGADGTGAWIDLTSTTRKSVAADTSIPEAVDGDGALLSAQKIDRTLLYALRPDTQEPSGSATGSSPTGSAEGTP